RACADDGLRRHAEPGRDAEARRENAGGTAARNARRPRHAGENARPAEFPRNAARSGPKDARAWWLSWHWKKEMTITLTRHSGARRSREPGIHKPESWLWIPALAASRSAGMTSFN